LKLPLAQLASHLERGLAGFYLIAAEEPLLVAEATDAVRRAALGQGFDERSLHIVDRSFRWDGLLNAADSLSLFATRRIVEIRMQTPRPGDAGAKAIRALAEETDSDRIVLLSIQAKLDRSAAGSVWARTIEKHGVVVDIRPVNRSDLPGFIARRAKKHGLAIERDAAELLAERVEGNLLAADQELIKLALIRNDGRVDAAAVLESVASSARFDVFRLSDAVVAGDARRAMQVLEGLKTEGAAPALVLWALARELSLLAQLSHGRQGGQRSGDLMTRLGVWRSRQPMLTRALDRYSRRDLARLLRRAADVDRSVKGLDRLPVWESIAELVLEMLVPERGRSPA